MAKTAETKGKALKAFELTWVMYDPTDRFGVIMALFTLSPVFVTLMHVTLVTCQRDLDSVSMFLGQVVSEVINKILKKTINQQRPDGARMSGSGMPSAHSQFISYFASYAVAYTYSRLNAHRYIEQWFTIVGCIFLAVFTCYSRVRLGYHTKDQVVVGAIVGAIVGFSWHSLISTVSPWLFPLIAQSRLAQFFYLRDISHIPDLIVYQHELCYSDAPAFKTKFL
ncbi:hypothetical protein L914_08062 [Phytophthora nicotianae]|uniref:Dolichyldiphosphatase n=1 Tax=Phytophthora nicotianae TaxID=4792 RepID=W2NET3_PHYNI|nr:hypothetical protein L914_08062 [Phytophthora nicotianae]